MTIVEFKIQSRTKVIAKSHILRGLPRKKPLAQKIVRSSHFADAEEALPLLRHAAARSVQHHHGESVSKLPENGVRLSERAAVPCAIDIFHDKIFWPHRSNDFRIRLCQSRATPFDALSRMRKILARRSSDDDVRL